MLLTSVALLQQEIGVLFDNSWRADSFRNLATNSGERFRLAIDQQLPFEATTLVQLNAQAVAQIQPSRPKRQASYKQAGVTALISFIKVCYAKELP